MEDSLQQEIPSISEESGQVAHSYAVYPAAIANIVQSYVKNGIKNLVRYDISPNSSAARRKLDGRTEARII